MSSAMADKLPSEVILQKLIVGKWQGDKSRVF